MELEFQKQTSLTTKQREKSRATTKKTKFVGVRQRPSGKWVAEIKKTTQKIRMWLGTFDTAEEAARAYDEAACLLGGTNTRTNFVDNIPPTSALSMKIRNLLNKKQSIKLSATKKEASQNSTTTKMTSFNCSAISSPVVCSLSDDMQSFDDAYKPDFSHFSGGNEMGNFQFDYSSLDFDVMASGFDGIFSNQENGFEVPKNCGEISQMMIPEYFDKMTAERQISASLYAMNGVNEYWDNVDACGSNDAFWDLPMLSSNVVPNILSKLTLL